LSFVVYFNPSTINLFVQSESIARQKLGQNKPATLGFGDGQTGTHCCYMDDARVIGMLQNKRIAVGYNSILRSAALLCFLSFSLASSVAKGSVFISAYAQLLKTFGTLGPLNSVLLEDRFVVARGKLGPAKVDIEFRSEAFTSSRVRYARMVSFCSVGPEPGSSDRGYDVFNFLAIPDPQLDFPMFGADIVILPGGVLAAIDFQPMCVSSTLPNSDANEAMFRKWQDYFPSGGAMPAEAQRYFSPNALWTRFNLDEKIEGDPNGVDTGKLEKIQIALSEYLNAYCAGLASARTVVDQTKRLERNHFLGEYLQYKIENDPAKNMLVGAFGREWTSAVLSKVLFPSIVTNYEIYDPRT